MSLAVVLAIGVFAQAAAASPAPHYSLSIVEGETTMPEYSIEQTSGGTSTKQEVVIAIVHNGIEVARSSGREGASTSKVPAVGDVVKLESPAGTLIESVIYDGLPSIDPSVCVGSANFSGQRSESDEVEGGYFSLKLHPDPYGAYPEKTGSAHAQVTTLAGAAYSGGFLTALTSGQTVYASETVRGSLASGAIF